VSLVPLGGPARGLRTEGLRYPLRGEDLQAGSTRGISNELTAPSATVEVAAGALLVVVPHALPPP
jgi:thiamine pyrophosphokinase